METALRKYEEALRYISNPEGAAKVRRNLAVTSLRLAVLSAENANGDRLRYYVKVMCQHVEHREKLLQDPGMWETLVRKIIAAQGEASLTFEMRMALLRSCLAQTGFPTAERAALAFEAAGRLVGKAVMVTNGSSVEALEEAFHRGGPIDEEFRKWTSCKQYLIEACTLFETPGIQEVPGTEEAPRPFPALLEQAGFLSHRAAAVLELFRALRSQTAVLLADDSWDMDAVLDVMDSLTGAVLVSQKDDTSQPILNRSTEDVELCCMSLSYLGQLQQRIGLPEQAKRRYTDCVRRAITMTTAPGSDYDSVIAGRVPPERVYQKRWFREATTFLRNAQKEVEEAEEQAWQERVSRIKGAVSEMQDANTSMVALTNFLMSKYVIDTKLEPLAEPVTKGDFMKVLRAYSQDKQTTCPAGWPHDLAAWKDFCTEAAKCLNFYYEVHYK